MEKILSVREADVLNNQLPANQNFKSGSAIRTASGRTAIKVSYDFNVHGGDEGVIDLGEVIPAGAIVTGFMFDEITNLTNGGGPTASIQVKAGSTALSGVLTIDTFTVGTPLKVSCTGSVDGIKVATESAITLTIATNAITAGAIDIYVEILRG